MHVRAFLVTPSFKHTFTGRQIAALGEAIGDEATAEPTPLQQLLVEMNASRACSTREAVHGAGMKAYEIGALVTNVRACSFCLGDEVAGYALAAVLDRYVAGETVPFPCCVAYAGCPAACSEPLLHDIGVVKTATGFDLFCGGRAWGLSPRPGVLVARGIGETDLVGVVRRTLLFYRSAGRAREPFWKFVDRVGEVALALVATNFNRGKQGRRSRAPGKTTKRPSG